MITDAAGWELEPTPWARQASCAGCSPDLWFPDKGSSLQPAIDVCRQCPVQTECLDYALRWNVTFGVWGGTSPRQREAIRARKRPPRPRRLPAPHGTTSRYARGCRCDGCTQAQTGAAYDRTHPEPLRSVT